MGQNLSELVAVCHWIGEQGWAPATGGNMSIRQDDQWCLLSESGRDKGALNVENFLSVNIFTNQAADPRTPSAETGLHTFIYRHYPDAQAVLHIHSINATVLSRLEPQDELVLQGYEMQKTLSGQTSHQPTITIPIFDNQQDIDALVAEITASQKEIPWGFLLRGHGLTCWGRSIAEARRHLEGLEFLFTAELNLRSYA